jgi:hypothetical protein
MDHVDNIFTLPLLVQDSEELEALQQLLDDRTWNQGIADNWMNN